MSPTHYREGQFSVYQVGQTEAGVDSSGARLCVTSRAQRPLHNALDQREAVGRPTDGVWCFLGN